MIKWLSSKKKEWVGTNSPLEWTDPRQPCAAPPKRSACHSGAAWLYQMPILGRPGKRSPGGGAEILRIRPCRFYFHGHEWSEPPYIHVDRDQANCKMWLNLVALASGLGFKAAELRDIEQLVSANRAMLE